MRLLSTSNRELRAHRIATWSIPALSAELSDGSRIKTCPNAGVCAALCYARTGTYRFSNVLRKHTANLERVLNDRDGWIADMVCEVNTYHRGRWVRIHDAGDFFSADYLAAWCEITTQCPDTMFYAYTKEVTMTRDRESIPENLLIVFSLGGKEDHLIDLNNDRHADVFPDLESLVAAGYSDQSDDDRLAVIGPKRVGIPSNNLKHLRRKQGRMSFGQLQRTIDERRNNL